MVDEYNNRLGTIVGWKNITSNLKVKTTLEDEISKLIDCVNKRDLTCRVEIENKEGFMKSLVIGMNQLSEIIKNVLTSVDKYLKVLTGGNLDQRIEDNFSGMFDTIKQNVNTAAEKLKSIIFLLLWNLFIM